MAAVLCSGGHCNMENLFALCQVPEEKIRLSNGYSNSLSLDPTLTFTSGKSVSGFRTVATYLATIAKENGICNLLGSSPLEKAEIDQWFEFCQTHVDQSLDDRSAMKLALGDMNNHLSSRVYFVGSFMTLADVVLFYSVHLCILEWSCQEKEKYLNVSRWYNQIQSFPGVRQDLVEIPFYRNVLYS